MNKKVLTLRAKSPEELSDEINKISENTIATQIFQDRVSSEWIAFCWYEPKEKDLPKLSNEEKPTLKKNWREEPATEPQKKKLDKLRIKYFPNIKKGQASDLINKAEGKR